MTSTTYNGTGKRNSLASAPVGGANIATGISVDHSGGVASPWLSNVFRGWLENTAGASLSSVDPITLPVNGSVTGWIYLNAVGDQPLLAVGTELTVEILGGQLQATHNGVTAAITLPIVAGDWYCYSVEWVGGTNVKLSALRRSDNTGAERTEANATAYVPAPQTLHLAHDGAGNESLGRQRELCVFDDAGTLVDAWIKTVAPWSLFQADLHNDVAGRTSLDSADFSAITWPKTTVSTASTFGTPVAPQEYKNDTGTGTVRWLINARDGEPNPQLVDAYVS